MICDASDAYNAVSTRYLVFVFDASEGEGRCCGYIFQGNAMFLCSRQSADTVIGIGVRNDEPANRRHVGDPVAGSRPYTR